MGNSRGVLFLSPSFFSKGGIQRHNQLFVRALYELGYSVDLIDLFDPETDVYTAASEVYVACRRLSFMGRLKFVLHFIWRSITRKYQYVFCGHLNFLLPTAIICLLMRRKFFLLGYGTDVWNIKCPFIGYFIKKCSGIFVASKFTQETMEKGCHGIKNLFVLYPCIAPELERANYEPGNDFPEKKLVLLSVGRLDNASDGKGFETMIELMPELLKIKSDLSYVIVGKGERMVYLKNRAAELSILECVSFTGEISDVQLIEEYKRCDIFVLPSRIVEKNGQYLEGEGFGMVFIEAARFGKPVVGLNQGGAFEAIQDGVNGFLAEAGNNHDLFEKIKRLILDVSLRRQMGEAGRKWVESNFSFDQFKNRIAEILKNYQREGDCR